MSESIAKVGNKGSTAGIVGQEKTDQKNMSQLERAGKSEQHTQSIELKGGGILTVYGIEITLSLNFCHKNCTVYLAVFQQIIPSHVGSGEVVSNSTN